jgi:hypothetical protein
MKIKKHFSLICLGIMTLVLYSAGQSNVVYYGTNSNSLSVAFADTNLSELVKSAITADLRVCLSEWGKGELRLRIKGDSVGYIDNPTRCPYYPEDIEFPENVVSNGVSGLALYIPKKLIDAYTNAFAFAAANSNIIAAAYEFVAYVSSTNFYTVTSNEIANYILVKNATPDMYLLSFADTTNSLRKQTYYPPSVLGFSYSPSGPIVSNLWVQIPCSNPVPWEGVTWGTFPAIWHDNKWKFCIWDNWVP